MPIAWRTRSRDLVRRRLSKELAIAVMLRFILEVEALHPRRGLEHVLITTVFPAILVSS
jgi:hypothetical protein